MEKQPQTDVSYLASRMVAEVLINLPHLEPEIFRQFILLLHTSLEALRFEKGERVWAKNESSLREFFDSLQQCGRLDKEENWDNFRNVLLGIIAPHSKIRYKGNINELVYVFDRFTDEGIVVQHDTPHVRLKSIFLNKSGKPLSSGSLGTILGKGVANKKNEAVMDEIIKQVLRKANGI